MKLILYFASLTVLLATTGCIVPVRERTYVQRQEYPRHHHWEHRGAYQYYYYER